MPGISAPPQTCRDRPPPSFAAGTCSLVSGFTVRQPVCLFTTPNALYHRTKANFFTSPRNSQVKNTTSWATYGFGSAPAESTNTWCRLSPPRKHLLARRITTLVCCPGRWNVIVEKSKICRHKQHYRRLSGTLGISSITLSESATGRSDSPSGPTEQAGWPPR